MDTFTETENIDSNPYRGDPGVMSVPAVSADAVASGEPDWLGEDVPPLAHIPDPKLWRVVVKQIGIKKKIVTASGHEFLMPDQVVADQEWTHGMCIVVKVGPAVYRGKKFEDLGLTPEDGPQVGHIYSFEARQPKRFKVDGVQLIELADDALSMQFHKDHLHRVSFQVG